MNERRVASSVRSLDLDVRLDHLNANVGCRCRSYGSGNARAHQEGCKVAPCEVSRIRLVARLVFLVVCHGFSCSEFIAHLSFFERWDSTSPSRLRLYRRRYGVKNPRTDSDSASPHQAKQSAER